MASEVSADMRSLLSGTLCLRKLLRSRPFGFLQVGAQTETELKEKKLRVEDALNATKVRCRMLPEHPEHIRNSGLSSP